MAELQVSASAEMHTITEEIQPAVKTYDGQVNKVEEKNAKVSRKKKTTHLDANCGSSAKQARLSLSCKSEKSNGQKKPNGDVQQKLFKVISNLYINAVERLCLQFPPLCAEDISYCYVNHFRTEAPEIISSETSQLLNYVENDKCYIQFLINANNICQSGKFPGSSIFMYMTEVILSTNQPYGYESNCAAQYYYETVDRFTDIVNTFPPCWQAVRRHYFDFFEKSINPAKLTSDKNKKLSKSDRVFDTIIDLLEHTLNRSDLDFLQEKLPMETRRTSRQTTPTPDDYDQTSLSASPTNSELNRSGCETLNDLDEKEKRRQNFDALSANDQLERIFDILKLFVRILENDLVMWILRHHKKLASWIFDGDNRPLLALIFNISQFIRVPPKVRQFLTLFAIGVNKGLSRLKLKVLERYIALLSVYNSIADLEYNNIGVKYPYLGKRTKNFIHQFFKIFKGKNSTTSAFVNAIDILRTPFLRYEFIDHFLKLHNFPKSGEMSPKKIIDDMIEHCWDNKSTLSREQYFKLLLLALKSYCQFHGTTEAYLHLCHNTEIECFKTRTESRHHWPVLHKNSLCLEKMAEDIAVLEQKLKLTVNMSKPWVDVPSVGVCIDENLILKYRNDFKFLSLIRDYLVKENNLDTCINLEEWLNFLNVFDKNHLKKNPR